MDQEGVAVTGVEDERETRLPVGLPIPAPDREEVPQARSRVFSSNDQPRDPPDAARQQTGNLPAGGLNGLRAARLVELPEGLLRVVEHWQLGQARTPISERSAKELVGGWPGGKPGDRAAARVLGRRDGPQLLPRLRGVQVAG